MARLKTAQAIVALLRSRPEASEELGYHLARIKTLEEQIASRRPATTRLKACIDRAAALERRLAVVSSAAAEAEKIWETKAREKEEVSEQLAKAKAELDRTMRETEAGPVQRGDVKDVDDLRALLGHWATKKMDRDVLWAECCRAFGENLPTSSPQVLPTVAGMPEPPPSAPAATVSECPPAGVIAQVPKPMDVEGMKAGRPQQTPVNVTRGRPARPEPGAGLATRVAAAVKQPQPDTTRLEETTVVGFQPMRTRDLHAAARCTKRNLAHYFTWDAVAAERVRMRADAEDRAEL